jgi:hypothetical protein
MKDIIFDNTGTLLGEMESSHSHQVDILTIQKGWNHFSPQIGVGIIDFIDDDENATNLKSAITFEFERDGMNINGIIISDTGKLNIDASY